MRHKNTEKSKMWKVKSIGVATLLTFACSLSTVMAQEAISATGGNASGSGGSVSYSIGQVAYQTHTGTGGSVTEGVQQPYEILVVTGIEEGLGINLSVLAYPNPTTDFLNLKIENYGNTNLSYQLFEMNGKRLKTEKITGNETSITMNNLVPATYFLKVIEGNKEIKTFRIIKN